MQIQKTDNTSFKMVRLASAETKLNHIVNKFELYRVTPEDAEYLQSLVRSINLKE